MPEYDNPFTIYDVKNKSMLKNNESGLSLNGNKISEGQKDELFKFSYGVCNDQPFFMLKGNMERTFLLHLMEKI